MISLADGLAMLWADLTAQPMRISTHRELPFAIFRYDPSAEGESEFEVRRQIHLLSRRLESERGLVARQVALAELLDEGVSRTRGWPAVEALERSAGFERAQEAVAALLAGPRFDLVDALAARINGLAPRPDVVFLVRVGALAPALFHVSAILKAMKDRTTVPAVLFYPGTAEGATGLRFYGMKHRDLLASYHVNIYRGGE